MDLRLPRGAGRLHRLLPKPRKGSGICTNSYHVHVSEEIDAFDKLKFEGMFQQLSPGGAISYVEVPNMQDNRCCL